MSPLLCPVRTCGQPLSWNTTAATCPAGHNFDRARSGYCNLLQPQDRQAAEPGDTAEAVAARRRTFDRGLMAPITAALIEVARGLPPGARVLDVGCGEGSHVGALAAALPVEAWGVDLSRAAIDAAARRYPNVRFVIANADRRLPFADGAFALVTSITGPKKVDELHRLLGADGRLVLGTSAKDDLAELRAALFGAAHDLDRRARMLELFTPRFSLLEERVVTHTTPLQTEALADLVATTYRAGRHRERERLAQIGELAVTMSLRLMIMKPV